jgi:hypothetical protein
VSGRVGDRSISRRRLSVGPDAAPAEVAGVKNWPLLVDVPRRIDADQLIVYSRKS